jgi:ABC-type sugar transport system permease subunit
LEEETEVLVAVALVAVQEDLAVASAAAVSLVVALVVVGKLNYKVIIKKTR